MLSVNGVFCRVSESGLEEVVLCLSLYSYVSVVFIVLYPVSFLKIFINNTSLMILQSGELSGYYSKGSGHECR